MEHNKSNYQPPLVDIVGIIVRVFCDSSRFTTDDSNYVNGNWDEEE